MRVFKADAYFCGRTSTGYALVCENLTEWGHYIRDCKTYVKLKEKLGITDGDIVAAACPESVDWKNMRIDIKSQETEVFLKEEVTVE